MEWRNVKYEKSPETTGNYLASVVLPYASGSYVFTDLLPFNVESKKSCWMSCS